MGGTLLQHMRSADLALSSSFWVQKCWGAINLQTEHENFYVWIVPGRPYVAHIKPVITNGCHRNCLPAGCKLPYDVAHLGEHFCSTSKLDGFFICISRYCRVSQSFPQGLCLL